MAATAIGGNLKRLRAAAGLTQRDLADAAGLSLSVVFQVEQGASADPRASTLRALAAALRCSVDQLLLEPAEQPAAAPRRGRRTPGRTAR